MITRYTTPYHIFILSLSKDEIDKVYVTYLQNGEVLFEKSSENEGDMEIREILNDYDNASMGEDFESVGPIDPSCEIIVHLTQEDTGSFTFYPAAEKNIAVIQLRITTSDGEAYASETIRQRIFGVLKEGVISND